MYSHSGGLLFLGVSGGALISTLLQYFPYGDPELMECLRRLLTAVSAPLLTLLTRWIFDGFLDDPFDEVMHVVWQLAG